MATRHQLCGLVLETDFALPEVPLCAEGAPDCYFELLPASVFRPGDYRWKQQWYRQDAPQAWLSCGRDGDDFLYRYADYGDFLISADVRHIRCRPLPQADECTLRHLLLDHILPLVLSRREPLVLHGSAVVTPEGAAGFIGGSGQGKSTLALEFAKHGCELLSDDCLALRPGTQGWMALPYYPGVRLWPEAAQQVLTTSPQAAGVAEYTLKCRISDPAVLRFATAPVALRALYFLDEPNESGHISIREVVASEAFLKLTHFAFQLDSGDSEFLKRQFKTVAQVRGEVPCFDLSYARDFRTLAGVRQAVLRHVGKSSR